MKYFALVGLLLAGTASAEPTHIVRPLTGYKCMKLALSDMQAMDFSGNSRVWILADPEPDARHLQGSPSVVLVKVPEHQEHGYVEVLTARGNPGWLEAEKLKPYDGLCRPALLSNGAYTGG